MTRKRKLLGFAGSFGSLDGRVGLAVLILGEALSGHHAASDAAIAAGPLRFAIGLLAGLGIGAVAPLLGVAGGELLIPTQAQLLLLGGLLLISALKSLQDSNASEPPHVAH